MTLSLDAVRAGGKGAVAQALVAIETHAGSAGLIRLLDDAAASPRGHVLGLTGPPGVGKSTLVNALIRRERAAGRSVAVLAADPSSARSGGALLGDRTRLRTDPEDEGVFVRSVAARDHLGGLTAHAVASVALFRAVYDLVIVETVGVGQSEGDIAAVADTVALLIQPGSGDSLQFMKAGVMELPQVVAVTKADLGAPARRARADAEGALALALAATETWPVPVILVSAATGEGLDDFVRALAGHAAWLDASGRRLRLRAEQARRWVLDAVKARFGTAGVAAGGIDERLGASPAPFAAITTISVDLARRLARRE